MRHECRKVRSEIQILKMLKVIFGIVPGHCLRTLSEHGLWDIFYSGETVNDGFLTIRLLSTKTGYR